MRIFVTGGGGYIGSALVPFLMRHGHSVTLLDRFFFGVSEIPSIHGGSNLNVMRDDIRWFDGKALEGHDAVIDMAALSNDPSGELDPWKTIDINYLGRARVARLAREARIRRYVLISSCSVYGFQDKILNEESPTNPLTAYARANLHAERDNLPLRSSEFTTTVLRLATVYGLSRRMRFDLAVNGMVLGGVMQGKIPIMKDGTQWRPFVHVHDVSMAISQVLSAPESDVNGEIFNIGSDSQNYQVKELAELVAKSLTSRPQLVWYGAPDTRSYRVSFEKARRVLRFAPEHSPEDATREIEDALHKGTVTDSLETRTVEWYRHLLTDAEAGAKVALRGVVL